jgi:TonB family protein
VTPTFDEFPFVSFGDLATYPPIAQNARVTGIVVLEVSVDAKGAVTDSRLLTGVPLLTQAAVDHSKRWQFHPVERRRGIIVYEFALDKRDFSTVRTRRPLIRSTSLDKPQRSVDTSSSYT